jgi:hypothetical protein
LAVEPPRVEREAADVRVMGSGSFSHMPAKQQAYRIVLRLGRREMAYRAR